MERSFESVRKLDILSSQQQKRLNDRFPTSINIFKEAFKTAAPNSDLNHLQASSNSCAPFLS